MRHKKLKLKPVIILLLILGSSFGYFSSISIHRKDFNAVEDLKSSAEDYTFETGWWKFDEGLGDITVDYADRNQNGTIYNATWTSDSKIGDFALNFDGVDDYVDIDYDLPNMDFTMCAWYKTESLLAERAIISEGLGGESQSTNVQSILIWDELQIGIRTETGSGVNHDYKFTPSGNIIDGQWHFIAAIITSGTLVMFWDDQKFTTSMINTDTLSCNCWVGCYGGPASGQNFNGSIDDVRIYECPLNDAEISWLYNNGDGREEKLNDHEYKIGWWTLDEGIGSIAEDYIDGDQNGTIYGAAWTSDSKIGDYALSFDGVDYIDPYLNNYIDPSYNLPNVGYTMCAWYKTTVGGKRDIIAEGADGESRNTNTQELCLFSDTEIGFKTETGSSGTDHTYKFTPGDIIDGQWHFVAVIVTSGNLVFYWDDQRFSTSIINSDTTADNCWIGNYAGPEGGTPFNGIIDDIRIYERILSDNEITEIYNYGEGLIPPEITINSPTGVQIFSNTAPSYNLSIIGLYDSIWYALEGGTNHTISGLTGTIDQIAWSALSDGIITIDFYANNSAGMIGTAQVQVLKNSYEAEPPPAISGYNIYILVGALGIIVFLLIKKKK